MSKAAAPEFEDAAPDPSTDINADVSALIDSLRAAGADRFDSMGLHYIEVLAKRGTAHQGRVRRLLDARLAQALAAFQQRFEQAQSQAKETIDQAVPHHPHAANALQQLFSAGDFKGLAQFAATLETGGQRASLGALVRQFEQDSADNADVRLELSPEMNLEQHAAPRVELKTIRRFRNTWSKLSAEKQLTQALEQAPKNAGPINSHMLVLRSLALMRDISPDYLNRFMSYADTLLCLDQSGKDKLGNAKKIPVAKAAKK